MGNQIAVWTFMSSLPDYPLSLNFRSSDLFEVSAWVDFGWVTTEVIQSGNKRNKFGIGHQEIKYNPSLWLAKSKLLSFGWIFFSNLYFFHRKLKENNKLKKLKSIKLTNQHRKETDFLGDCVVWVIFRLVVSLQARPGEFHFSQVSEAQKWDSLPLCTSLEIQRPDRSLVLAYLTGTVNKYTVWAKSLCRLLLQLKW